MQEAASDIKNIAYLHAHASMGVGGGWGGESVLLIYDSMKQCQRPIVAQISLKRGRERWVGQGQVSPEIIVQ